MHVKIFNNLLLKKQSHIIAQILDRYIKGKDDSVIIYI